MRRGLGIALCCVADLVGCGPANPVASVPPRKVSAGNALTTDSPLTLVPHELALEAVPAKDTTLRLPPIEELRALPPACLSGLPGLPMDDLESAKPQAQWTRSEQDERSGISDFRFQISESKSEISNLKSGI